MMILLEYDSMTLRSAFRKIQNRVAFQMLLIKFSRISKITDVSPLAFHNQIQLINPQ